jgi:hypothetical protein
MSSTADLSVRQHERHPCDVAAGMLVSGQSVDAVKLVKTGAGGAPGRVVDFSRGGLGLSSTVYFPLTCHLRVSIPDNAGGSIKIDLRVQRVAMLDRTPTYYIGTSFDATTPEQQKAVAGVLAHFRALPAPLEKEGRVA